MEDKIIGICTQAFEWYYFEWSWVTCNPDFKVTYFATSSSSKTVPDKALYIHNGGPIKGGIWSIERRHLQWPWTTLIPSFKVTPFFDAENLRNGTRYIHSFDEILIGTYTHRIQQCYLVTLGDIAKYSMTRSVARSLCDSWASCKVRMSLPSYSVVPGILDMAKLLAIIAHIRILKKLSCRRQAVRLCLSLTPWDVTIFVDLGTFPIRIPQQLWPYL